MAAIPGVRVKDAFPCVNSNLPRKAWLYLRVVSETDALVASYIPENTQGGVTQNDST
jgi:hypothetical protein